jgi:GMC oxidoreductase
MGIDHISDTDKPTFPHGPIQVSFSSLTQKSPMDKAWNEVFRDTGQRQQLTSSQNRLQAIDATQLLLTHRQRKACLRTHNMASRSPNAPTLQLSPRQQCSKSCSQPLRQRRPLRKVFKCQLMATPVRLRRTKKVILSAGAFHTAKLLELSGVGEPSRLRNLAIPLVIENANVIENLQNDVMCMRTFELDQGVKVGDGIQSLAFLPLLDRVQQKETFYNAPPRASRNEKDFYDVVRGIFDSRDEASCSMFMSFIGLPNFASLGVMQSIPFSRGNSHITSANLDDNPRIDPQFFSNPLDLEIMAHHLLALKNFPRRAL